jgi:hypothetical protein
MTDAPIQTTPVKPGSKLLQEKSAESVAGQSELMDKLARQLITLELAIPGIYAAVLKLVQGKDATLPVNNWLIFPFACWFLALLLTLISLIPRRWEVDPTMLKPDLAGSSKALGLRSISLLGARPSPPSTKELMHRRSHWRRRCFCRTCCLPRRARSKSRCPPA